MGYYESLFIINFIFIIFQNIITILLIILCYKKIQGNKAFKSILTLGALSIWNTLTILPTINIRFNISVARYIPISLTIFLILGAIIGVSSIQIVPIIQESARLPTIIKIIGWMLIGLLLSHFFNSSINLISIERGALIPIPQQSPIFSIIFGIWSTLILIFLYKSELGEKYKYRIGDRKLEFLFFQSVFLIIFGLVILLFLTLLSPFDLPYQIMVYSYILSKNFINIGIILLLIVVLDDPRAILPLTRSIYSQFHQNKIAYALINFEQMGPNPMYYSGYSSIIPAGQNEHDYVNQLGIIGMTTLGLGDRYIEGSAVIPIPGVSDHITLIFSSFVRDTHQQDTRLKDQNFLVLVITIPRNLRWIIQFHESLSKKFILRVRQIEDLSYFTKEDLSQFIENNLLDIAIKV